MVYIAAAELGVILLLVLLYRKARDHEVQAILDVMADNTAERAELLNAARHPNFLLRQQKDPSMTTFASPEELERMRAHAEAFAKIGTVEDPR